MNYEIKNAYRERKESSPCITRPMTDKERLEQGKPRPNSQELYWILKNPKKSAEYQNTYGLSNEYMTELRQCMAQKGYENGLGAKATRNAENKEAISKLATATYKVYNQAEFEDAAVPMGLRGEAIVVAK
jgi:hypothetical protein